MRGTVWCGRAMLVVVLLGVAVVTGTTVAGGSIGRRSADAHRLVRPRLNSAVGAGGVTIDSGLLHLGLSASGRAGALRTLPRALPARGPRTVIYSHPGVTEWYTRGPAGLQQGFTVSARPAGTGPLTMQVGTVGAGATAHLSPGGATLAVGARDGGALLTYGGLRVTDATGRRVPAMIALSGRRILLKLDDGAARYPLRVDPYVQQQLIADPGSGKDEFGDAVAIDGNTMVVGAPNDKDGTVYFHGAVFVFSQTSPGMWTLEHTLTAGSTAYVNEYFGTAVAVEGTTLVVGAPDTTVGDNSEEGAAYVFTESGGTWTQAKQLTGNDAAAGSEFGDAVAISGNTIAVGAPHQTDSGDDSASDSGAVYVFTGSSASWTQTAKLEPSVTASNAFVGETVAIAGTTIVVGAPGVSDFAGAVYEFTEDSANDDFGSGVTQTTLPAPTGAGTNFGEGVAVDGNTLVVGDPGFDGDNGAGYVYVSSTGTWPSSSQAAILETPAVDENPPGYGNVVAVSGQMIVIGNGAPDCGNAVDCSGSYAFTEPSGGWQGTPSGTMVPDGGYPAFFSGGLATGDADYSDDAGAVYSFLYESGDYALGVTTSGSGTVTSSPAGIDCPGACSADFASGTQVTLTESPPGGSMFTGWSGGGCSGTDTSCVVTMSQAQNVTATFTPDPQPNGYTLSVSKPGSGSGTVTSSPGGIDCGDTCSAGYAAGSQVTLTESPAAGSAFAGWSGGCSGTGTTCAVTMSAAQNVTATFNAVAPPAPGGSVAVPTNTAAPVVSGQPLPTRTLTCSPGKWSNDPSAYTYQWFRAGVPIPGAVSSTYVVQIADEASGPSDTLVCVVTARNAAGAGKPADSNPVLVASGSTQCPRPTGTLTGSRIGPLRLGETQSQARRTLHRFQVTANRFDNFCLYAGWGIRVAYPTAALLRSAPSAAGLRGQGVLALTANPFYAFEGARPGMTERSVARRLHLGRPFHVGSNYWYISPAKPANGVLKVRHGIIQEVGLANAQLTANRAAQKRLFDGFPDG